MRLAPHWRVRQQRYQLRGEVCECCGEHLFPPRDVCPACHQPANESFAFSGEGTVYSYSTVYEPPRGYERFAPYTVALVRLKEGPLVTAQLTDVDPDDVRIGLPVEMVTRVLREEGKEGMIIYGYKFRPVLDQAAAPVAP
jgi:uncharacterized OB-fold protein